MYERTITFRDSMLSRGIRMARVFNAADMQMKVWSHICGDAIGATIRTTVVCLTGPVMVRYPLVSVSSFGMFRFRFRPILRSLIDGWLRTSHIVRNGEPPVDSYIRSVKSVQAGQLRCQHVRFGPLLMLEVKWNK